MGLIMVSAPEGTGDAVAGTAPAVEIDKISRRRIESRDADTVYILTNAPRGALKIQAE